MEPKAKPISFIVVAIAVAAFFGGLYVGGNVSDKTVELNLSQVHKRDSIIAEQEAKIGGLTHRVNERDSIIVYLSGKEDSQRDTVFFHLEDRFEGAPDSTRESLINEALNAIQ